MLLLCLILAQTFPIHAQLCSCLQANTSREPDTDIDYADMEVVLALDLDQSRSRQGRTQIIAGLSVSMWLANAP
jgi:hypothetical protein